MTKDNTINKPLEIYGNFMRLMHFDTKGKNLQDFSSKVFEAAGLDLQEDKKLEGKSYNPKKLSSTTHLDKCIDNFVSQLTEDKNDAAKLKEEIKANVIEGGEYSKLKETLDYVRVQGVGKDVMHKIGAITGMVGRLIGVPVAVAMGVASVVLNVKSYEHRNEAMGDLFQGDVKGVAYNGMAANFANREAGYAAKSSGDIFGMSTGPTIDLMDIRQSLKDKLEGVITPSKKQTNVFAGMTLQGMVAKPNPKGVLGDEKNHEALTQNLATKKIRGSDKSR